MNPYAVYEIMEFSCLNSLVLLFPTLFLGIIYACLLWSCRSFTSSPEKTNDHFHTQGFTRICSCDVCLFKEGFNALSQRQSHWDKNCKPSSEASEWPCCPPLQQSSSSISRTATEKELLTPVCSNAISVENELLTPLCSNSISVENELLTPLCSNSTSVESSRQELCSAVSGEQFQVSSSRKSTSEKFSELTERIKVYVRLRPLSKKEEKMGGRSCVDTVGNKDLLLKEIGNKGISSSKKNSCQTYTFDAVFPESVEQQEVYNASTAELVDAILHERNACVFCYGATGAGKTHTMLGTVETPGIVALSIIDVFAKIGQQKSYHEPVVMLSYLEIYNESVKDLLSPGKPLVLREDKQGYVSLLGISQHRTHSTKEVMELIHHGNQNRTTASTQMNETSSRSHAIIQVAVEWKVNVGLGAQTRKGKLSLVDLAGSERAVATNEKTIRSTEGSNINKSLLALSSCVNALVERKSHIPYRDSKLTQLLKDSLGGTCQTAIVANISPSDSAYTETKNTLHWANRAKDIRTSASIANEGEVQIEDSELVLEMQKEIQHLRMQNNQLQRKLIAFENQTPGSTPYRPSLLTTPPCTCTIHTPRSKLSSNKHSTGKYAKKINNQGLKRNIQAFKEESEHLKIESAMQKKQPTSHLLSIKSGQCKRKPKSPHVELKSASSSVLSTFVASRKKHGFGDTTKRPAALKSRSRRSTKDGPSKLRQQ